MTETTARAALIAEASNVAHKFECTQTSSHGTCALGDEPDEDGYVECDECGIMSPSITDA